jgi:hypothetical protein
VFKNKCFLSICAPRTALLFHFIYIYKYVVSCILLINIEKKEANKEKIKDGRETGQACCIRGTMPCRDYVEHCVCKFGTIFLYTHIIKIRLKPIDICKFIFSSLILRPQRKYVFTLSRAIALITIQWMSNRIQTGHCCCLILPCKKYNLN